MRNRVRKAFTLVEILIVVVILGILAAIVVPQFTNASQEAQIGNVETQLQTIRSQIELYRVRNNGQYPAFPFATQDGWGDDTNNGMIDADYLRTAPVNPRNGSSQIVAAEDPGTAADPAGPGWYFSDGEITAAGFDEATRSWR